MARKADWQAVGSGVGTVLGVLLMIPIAFISAIFGLAGKTK